MLYKLLIVESILALCLHHRYQREFGFIIPNREITVDDVRVRGIGKSHVDLDQPIPEADGPPRVEKVFPYKLSNF